MNDSHLDTKPVWVLHRVDADDPASGTQATGPILHPGEEVKVVPITELSEANLGNLKLIAQRDSLAAERNQLKADLDRVIADYNSLVAEPDASHREQLQEQRDALEKAGEGLAVVTRLRIAGEATTSETLRLALNAWNEVRNALYESEDACAPE